MERVNCDIFMKENSVLNLSNDLIIISGNFYAEKNCTVTTGIFAGGDVIFEDYADTAVISAEGNVELGAFSDSSDIWSTKSISIGNFTFAKNLSAEEDIFIGYQSYAMSILYGKDIFYEDYCTFREYFIHIFYKMKNWLFHHK